MTDHESQPFAYAMFYIEIAVSFISEILYLQQTKYRWCSWSIWGFYMPTDNWKIVITGEHVYRQRLLLRAKRLQSVRRRPEMPAWTIKQFLDFRFLCNNS